MILKSLVYFLNFFRNCFKRFPVYVCIRSRYGTCMMTDSDDNIEELLTDYVSGQALPEEKRLLASLLKKDEQKRRLYAEFIRTRALAAIPHLVGGKKENFIRLRRSLCQPYVGGKMPRRYSLAVQLAVAVTALLLINAVVFYLYAGRYRIVEKHAEYCTSVPLGSVCNVLLPDGTEVMLNAGSSLRYSDKFGEEKREVFLKGEGYFKVKRDTVKPFCVCSDNAFVSVTGTVFNVKDYENETSVKVALQDGRVDVKFNRADSLTMSLKPNEIVCCEKESGKMVKISSDAGKQAGWTTGKFYFTNVAFPEMAREFERKYNIKIVIESKRLMREYFSGSFDYSYTINDILREVDIDKKYVWQRNNDVIVVKDRV